jgi:hypothetical protein
MIDMDDEKLKNEIDEITKSVDHVMREIEGLGLIKNEDPTEIKNEE